jgi:hypothetical protein
MSDIPRFKTNDQMTAAEWLAVKRGDAPPESEAYRTARAAALADAGLASEGDPEGTSGDPTAGDMTSEQHLQHLQKGSN